MEVILKEDVNKLGHRGDVVKVANGYGRNYLLPGKLAIEATPANKAVIEQMKAAAIRKSAGEKDGAVELGAKLNEVALLFERKSGENNHLFGSVTTQDIAAALKEQGYDIDRRKIHPGRAAEDCGRVPRSGEDPPRSHRACAGDDQERCT